MRSILIIGCGDIALRAAPWLTARFRVFGLVRRADRAAVLRASGITPVMGDLDNLRSLRRLAGLADAVLHLAPPPGEGSDDPRTRHLLAALQRGILPRRLVYTSTSGVYGDCGGAYVDEARPVAPDSARAVRRCAAERRLRQVRGLSSVILRVPGIYAADRLPLERLRAGTPAIQHDEDGYTNHIHADDLARVICLALFRAGAGRVFNACDDAELKMGDWFDLVADQYSLPRPRRLPRQEIAKTVAPMLWSFMRESRILRNRRIKRELRVALRYPTPSDFFAGNR